jgi:hypothetical protein
MGLSGNGLCCEWNGVWMGWPGLGWFVHGLVMGCAWDGMSIGFAGHGLWWHVLNSAEAELA